MYVSQVPHYEDQGGLWAGDRSRYICLYSHVLLRSCSRAQTPPILVSWPCPFVACSMKKSWYILSCDVCRSLCHNPSTEFSDVVDELAHYLALKEPPPEITVMVHMRTYVCAKSFGSERAQAAIFSWIGLYQATVGGLYTTDWYRYGHSCNCGHSNECNLTPGKSLAHHYHLHPFHFMLFKFKLLVAKQHPATQSTDCEVLVSCPDPFRKNREGVW